mmetsp:Transcript_20192/g.33231  ORF Transcript_20192/g.33231 Transcript_20192/m.33231 type:complete len:1159 (-) Transcript_20192:151-3627(-)
MEFQDSSNMHEDEGVEIVSSSTHDDKEINGSSSSSTNEAISKKQITVLISSGNFNHSQTANQNSALQLLNDLSLPYVTIDGMDADLKAKRDALFEISGVRGNYPQLFLTTSNQGARKTMAATSFLGDFAWLENNSDLLVDMVMTPSPQQSLQQQKFDARLSALSSGGGSFGTGTSSSNSKEDTEQQDQNHTLTPKATANITQQLQNTEVNGAPELQVDWIPEEGGSQFSDVSLSQAAIRGDDVTETSFTTMTTVGDGGGTAVFPIPLTVVDESGTTANDTIGVYVRPIAGRNKLPARSPRPPRRMRAVDWCPPQHQPLQQQLQPSIVPSDRTRTSNPSISGVTPSVVTSRAVRMADDNTITTFATMTTMGDAGSILEEDMEDEESRSVEESVDVEEEVEEGEEINGDDVQYEDSMEEVEDGNGAVVDKIPKISNKQRELSISVATNQAVRAPDDHSVVTFATVATIGDRENSHVVDKLPSFTATRVCESVRTNETVQMGDHESVATWATMNTMRGQITGNVVDHVPTQEETGPDPSERSLRTTNAVQDERSITTFTTNATAFTERGIHEVVDKIPTFAGGSGRSVMSGVTNQAVRMNDDRSTASFATMTTAGDAFPQDRSGNTLVDRIPSFPERTNSVSLSGRTDAAQKLVDDMTATTFATLTTAGDAANNTYQNEDLRYSDHSGNDEVMSGSSASRPTTGILRESRHTIKLESPVVEPPTGGADDVPAHVSNAHILRAITDLRFHVDYRIGELREVNRRDSERVLQLVQQEQARRTALEARLHAQLLMQSESMVAMELKVLRLEAKIASHRLPRHQSYGGTTMDRLPPIAATPSTPNQSDEEADSFEELDLTPRATRSSSVGHLSYGGGNRGGPTNIAVVTRSGASVASAVTAMSFPDEGFSHMDHALNNDGSEDGDVEDEGDDNDGSQSTPTHGSRNQISNLESILLNPIPVVGSNDQGLSTRATRGDTDGNSSLPTSVTSTTMASTVVTAATRGDTSVGIARIPSRASASEEDALGVNIEEQNGNMSDDRPRSRDQSPLTVHSAATETLQSVASASLGPSILSTAAVASARSFGTRRANAANAEGRSLANRVVSFVAAERSVPPQENDGGGDSITMPDDLDNLSDIADAFSNSARAWREEYESRLDAIHKRLDSR